MKLEEANKIVRQYLNKLAAENKIYKVSIHPCKRMPPNFIPSLFSFPVHLKHLDVKEYITITLIHRCNS